MKKTSRTVTGLSRRAIYMISALIIAIICVFSTSSLLVFANVVVSSSASSAITLSSHPSNDTSDDRVPVRNLKDIKVLGDGEHGFTTEPVDPYIPTEQDRIDTIIRSLHHLPQEELDLMEIDLNQPIVHGTPQAERLFVLWEQRQRELQEIMKTVMKPAEYMASLIQKLMRDDELTHHDKHFVIKQGEEVAASKGQIESDSEGVRERAKQKASLLSSSAANNANATIPLTLQQKLDIFEELESLLTDIDNARDFHTIGAWPFLVSQLHHSQSNDEIRALVMWCMGSAVKNSYDYQLYLLEPMKFQELVHKEVSGQGQGEVDEVVKEYETTPLAMIVSILEQAVSRLLTVGTSNVNESEREVAHELVKKALYAISSGLRGNIDIQERLLAMPSSVSALPSAFSLNAVHASLYRLLSHQQHSHSTDSNTVTTIPLDIIRKVWSLLADSLDEREEIRSELVSYLRQLDIQQEREVNAAVVATGSGTLPVERQQQFQTQRESVINALSALTLFGDCLVTDLPSLVDSTTTTSSDKCSHLFVALLTTSLQRHVQRFQVLLVEQQLLSAKQKTANEDLETKDPALMTEDDSDETTSISNVVVETVNVESTLRSLLTISRHLLKLSPPPRATTAAEVAANIDGSATQQQGETAWNTSQWPTWQISIRQSIEEMSQLRKVLEASDNQQEVLDRYEDLFALVKSNGELLQLRQN